MLRSVMQATMIVTVLLLAFFLSSLLVAMIGADWYRERAQDAIRTGTFAEHATLFTPSTAPYRYNPNDCRILSMLATRNADPLLRRALSPMSPEVLMPDQWKARGLERGKEASGEVPIHEQCYLLMASIKGNYESGAYYHRYLHGYWVLAGLVLTVLSFAQATLVLLLASIAVPIALLSIVAWKAVKGATSTRDFAFGAMALAYLLFSGVFLFGWSFSFGPSEIVLTGFLLFAYLRPLSALSLNALVLAGAIFGCLTILFEFLTGAIPAGVALLFGIFAIESGRDERSAARRVVVALISFVGAIAFALALKAIVVALVWGGNELVAAESKLSGHMASGNWSIGADGAAKLMQFGISPETAAESRVFGFGLALAKLVYFSDLLTFGNHALGVVATVIGPAILLIYAGLRFSRSWSCSDRATGIMLVAAVGALMGWYFVFVSHTFVHAYFMQRPLAWLTIILSGILCRSAADRLNSIDQRN